MVFRAQFQKSWLQNDEIVSKFMIFMKNSSKKLINFSSLEIQKQIS